jgi:PITH domain
VAKHPGKRVNLNNVCSFTLFIEDNWSGGDEEVSRLWYIGFKGEWTELKDAPLVAVYEVSPFHVIEARANPADHRKVHAMLGTKHGFGH